MGDKFYVCNGNELNDLKELLNELYLMDNSTFSFHVNSEKNDFYNWIKSSLKKTSLAKKLLKVKDKENMISIIQQELTSKTKPKRREKKDIISQIKKIILND